MRARTRQRARRDCPVPLSGAAGAERHPGVSGTADSRATGQALRAAAGRTAALLRRLPDSRAIVPGLTWSVAETAAHLVTALETYRDLVLGTADAKAMLVFSPDVETPPQHSAAYNAAQLARFSERDPLRLADLLGPSVDAFLEAAAARPDGDRILTGTGLSMTVPTMTAALLGEQLIHGFDIARAGHIPWPISRTDALLVLGGVMVMLPDYLDRQRTAGLHVAYELRLRGGPRYRLQVDDGMATVTEVGRPVDCWVSADPATFLLLGYGRISRRSQIIRGRFVAGGRKPWLALAFERLLTGP
jgi:hypothetical protein